MQKFTRFAFGLAVAFGILASTLSPASADPSATSIWSKAEQRIKGMKYYTLQYNYNGPKGFYQFDYAVVRPDAVKTKIVKGENEGAILIYRPSEFGQVVKARKGWLGKSMQLNDPKVANTPVIKPVFDMLLEQVRGATAVVLKENGKVEGHDVFVLEVTAPTGKHLVSVSKATSDVLRWQYTDAEGAKDRIFYNINTTTQPRIDF